MTVRDVYVGGHIETSEFLTRRMSLHLDFQLNLIFGHMIQRALYCMQSLLITQIGSWLHFVMERLKFSLRMSFQPKSQLEALLLTMVYGMRYVWNFKVISLMHFLSNYNLIVKPNYVGSPNVTWSAFYTLLVPVETWKIVQVAYLSHSVVKFPCSVAGFFLGGVNIGSPL